MSDQQVWPEEHFPELQKQPFHVLIIGAGKHIAVIQEDVIPAAAPACLSTAMPAFRD